MPEDNLNPNTASQDFNQEAQEQSSSFLDKIDAYTPVTPAPEKQGESGTFMENISLLDVEPTSEEIGAQVQQFATEGVFYGDSGLDYSNPTPLEDFQNNLWATDWFNDFAMTINENQIGQSKGRLLEFNEGIDKLELEKEKLLASEASEEQKQQQLEELSYKQMLIQSSEEYLDAQEDLRTDQEDLASYSVSPEYAMQKHKRTQEEYSNPISYLLYESAADLGGNFSDLSTLAASMGTTAGLAALGNWAASAVATGASGGGATPWLIQSSATLAATVASAYMTYKMRENETYGEMSDAYEQRLGKMVSEAEKIKGGPLTSEEEAQIRVNAYKGLKQLKAQNMMLSSADILQTAMMVVPWGKTFNLLGKAGSTFAGRTATRVGSAVAASLSEGMEETSQYQMKKHFVDGLYRDGYTAQEIVKEGLNTFGSSLSYAVTGTTKENYENDPEFRNSFRSGAILGGGMHVGGAMKDQWQDRRMKKIVKNDLENISSKDLEFLKNVERADLLSRVRTSHGIDNYIETLEGMKTREGVDSQIVDEEINQAKQAKEIHNLVTSKHSHLTSDQQDKLFHTLMTDRTHHQLSDKYVNEAKELSNAIATKYRNDSSLIDFDITETLNRKKALEELIKEGKETGLSLGATAQKTLKQLEQKLSTLDTWAKKRIETVNEAEGKKHSEKDFTSYFDEEAITAYKNEYNAEITASRLKDNLAKHKSVASRDKYVKELQQKEFKQAEANKEEREEVKEAVSELSPEDQEKATKDVAPSGMPDKFITDKETGAGFEKGEDGNWYEFDGTGKSKVIQGTKEMTPEERVADAWMFSQAQEQERQKAEREEAAQEQAQDITSIPGLTLPGNNEANNSANASQKRDARETNPNKIEDEINSNNEGSVAELLGQMPLEKQEEQRGNAVYESSTQEDDLLDNAENNEVVNGKKTNKPALKAKPDPAKSTVGKSKKAFEEKNEDKIEAASTDPGNVITSVEMIDTDKKKDQRGVRDIYKDADPKVKHADEFDFTPLTESGKIVRGSNVYLEQNPNYKEGVYVFESNEKGEKIGKLPITQLRFRFTGKWANATDSKKSNQQVFEYFKKNPKGNLVLKVAKKTNGNIVSIDPNKLGYSAEERLANTAAIQDKSPWLLYGGKPTYAIAKENFLLASGNNRIDNDLNGTEGTGKIAKQAKEGATYIILNDGNGNPIIDKVINRNVSKEVAQKAIANLRALSLQERERYFKEVVSQVMYLDSEPKSGEAVNLSLKDDLYFYKNSADQAGKSLKIQENAFLDFITKKPYRTAEEGINTTAPAFTQGVQGKGYSVPLAPLFEINGNPMIFESYNDYMQNVAVYTTIKPEFPLHNTQLQLEAMDQHVQEEKTGTNIGEQEAQPQGFTSPKNDLKNTDEEIVNPELSQAVENEVQSPKTATRFEAKPTSLTLGMPPKPGSTKFKLADKPQYDVWNKEKELKWLDENLPKVPVRVLDSLERVHGQGGMNAWGSFSNGVIRLRDNAETGTAYHEAFHAVFDLYLSKAQQLRLLKETGIKDLEAAEEHLAEEFRKYVIKEKNPAKTTGIKRFFNELYFWVKDKLGLLKSQDLFKYIDSGNYSRRTPKVATTDQTKYRKIPGTTPEEHTHRIESIAYSFFDLLKQLQGVESIYQINPSNVEDSNVTDIFNAIHNYYLNFVDNSEFDPSTQNKAKAIITNWDLVTEEVKQKVRVFGYQINTTDLKIKEDDGTDQNNQDTNPEDGSGDSAEQKIYDRPAYEESAKKSLSREMKLFFNTIPKVGIDKEGNIAKDDQGNILYETDEFGMTRFHEFNSVYSKVAQRMANAATLEEMENRLQALAVSDNALAYVSQALENSPLEDVGGVKHNNFRSKFYATFYANYGNMVTIRKSEYDIDTTTDSENPTTDTRTTYHILDSNSSSQSMTIKNQWKSEIKKVQGKPIPGLTNAYKELEKKYKTSDYESFSKGVSNLVKKVGIDVSPEAIFNGMTTESNHFIHNLFVSKYGIKALLNAAEKGAQLLSLTAEEAKNGNAVKGEESTINKFAVLESLNRANLTGDAFKKSSGNTIHPIGMHNAITSKVDLLKDHNYISTLAQEEGYENNTILDILQSSEGKDKLQFAYFGEEYDSNKKRGTDFDKVVEGQINRDKLNAFLNSGKKEGWFALPALGDKSTNGFIKLFKQQGSKMTYPMPYLPGAVGLNVELVDKFVGMAKDEFMRIHREVNLIGKLDPKDQIENYHYRKTPGDGDGKAYYFQTFPELNNTLATTKLKGVPAESAWDTFSKSGIRSQLEYLIEKEINAEAAYLESLGLFKKDEEGQYKYSMDRRSVYFKNNRNIDSQALKAYGTTSSLQVKNALAHYATSSFIFNHEFSNLIGGDFALYKGKGDASKRFSTLGTPGTSLYTGEGGAKPTFTVGVLKDNYVDRSTTANMYKEFLTSATGLGLKENDPIVQRIAEAYKSPNQTDAQGYITLDRYKDILVGQGKWNKDFQREFKNLKEGNSTTGTIIMQPIKGIYSGTHNDGIRTSYDLIKYSSFPLIPAYTDKFPALKALREKMEKDGFDEVVFDSAYKVGKKAVAENPDQMSPIILPNSNWRIPQVIPEKQQDSSNMGSQMRKLIFQNIPEGSSLAPLKDVGQELLNRLIEIGHGRVMKSLKNKGDIARLLRDQISERDLTEIYEEAGMLDDKGDFKFPISHPLISRRIESIINSFIRKGITKGKMPGLQAVQVSSFGASKEDIGFDTDLKDVMFERTDTGWKVNPAEVYMSPEYFIKVFKKKGLDTSVLFDSEGNFNEDAIPKSMREVVLYRIPTQGKNSMLPVRIKGFLPKESGSSIVMPASITSLAGSDFDIDKVFVEMKNFKVEKDNNIIPVDYSYENISNHTVEEAQNALVDIHFKILTSPEVALEFITPLDGEVIDGIRDQVVDRYNLESDGSFASNRYQSDTVLKNQAGKNLVGTYALHTTFHAVAQDIDLEGPSISFKDSIILTPTVSLNTVENNEDGSLISDNFNESLNAAVDNAKDPKLGPINVNEFTAPVDALLTHYGRFKTAKYLLNQPIIRDYTEAYFRNITGNSRAGATKDAQNEVESKYKFSTNKTITLEDVTKVSIKELEKSITEKDQVLPEQKQIDIFHAYLALDKVAQDLNAMVIGLNADTSGVAATTQGNTLKEERFNEGVTYNESFSFDKNKLEKHSVYKYFTEGVQSPNSELKNLFIWATKGMTTLHSQAREKFNKPLNEKELASLQYSFYSYLFTEGTMLSDVLRVRDENGNVVKDLSKELLTTGDTSFASRVERFKEFEKKWQKEYGYTPSTFFENLTTIKDDDGVDFVRFNNTVADAIDKLSKDKMTHEIEQLYDGVTLPEQLSDVERKAAKQLMLDLVPYSFLTGGFQKSTNSFMDYIPTSIWKGGFGIVADHYKMSAKLLDTTSNQTSVFLRQYVQNNPNSTLLRTHKVSKASTQGKAQLYNARAKEQYIKDNDGNLYEHVQDSGEGWSKYSPLATIGRGQYLQEYLAGKTYLKSEFPRPEKPKTVNVLKVFAENQKKAQKQIDSGMAVDTMEETEYKIKLMKELFAEQGVEVDVEVDADIDANAQIVYEKGKKPLIQLKNAFKDTVFHEFGHLYIDLLGPDHTLIKKAKAQLKDSALYKEVKQNYPHLNQADLDNEVLATALGREGSEVFDSMQKANWWDRFVNMFYNVLGKIFPGLGRSAAQELANRMLTGQTEQLKLNHIVKADKIQQQVAKELGPKASKEVKRLADLKKELVDTFTLKLKIYRTKPGAEEFTKNLEQLLERLEKLDAKESSITFIGKAHEDLKNSYNQLNKLAEKGELTDAILYKYKDYASGYRVLEDVDRALRAEKVTIPEEFTQMLIEAEGYHKQIENIYFEELPKLVSKRMAKYSDKHTAEELEAYFKKVDKDITISEAMADFMGDSKDPVLALLAKMTDEAMQNVRQTQQEFAQTLHEKVGALEKLSPGKKDTDIFGWMLEKDDNGNLTGHYVSKYKSEYYKKKQEAFTKIVEDINKDDKFTGEKADDEMRLRKNQWHKENSIWAGNGYIPNNSWLNDQYAVLEQEMANDTVKGKFYTWFKEEYTRMQSKLPERHRRGTLLPVMRKSASQRIQQANSFANGFGIIKESIRDTFVAREDDIEKGLITNEGGRPIDAVPVFYTSENVPVEDRVFNLEELMSKFSHMSLEYEAKNDLVDTMEGARELVKKRLITKENSKGEKVLNAVKELFNKEVIEKTGAESNAIKQLDEYIKMVYYGQRDIDHGSINIFGAELDYQKAAKKLINVTSYLGMSFNFMANVSNVSVGETTNLAEAFAGEFYTFKDWLAGHSEWTKASGGLAADLYRKKPTNKISIVSDRLDVLGDYKGSITNPKNTFAKRATSVNPATALQVIGENMMQQSVMIAVLKHVKVTDKDGNKVDGIDNAWDAIKTDKGYVEVDSRVELDLNKESRKINTLIRRMHGNYNENTPIALQRHALGKLALQYRKWVRPGYMRRFDDEGYNEFLEKETAGSYKDFFTVSKGLLKELGQLRFDMASQKWSEMSEREKANFIRTASEIGFLTTSFVVMAALFNGEDEGPDDDWWSMFMYYQLKRYQSEMTFFVGVGTMDILRSPAASMSTVELSADLLAQLVSDTGSVIGGGAAERYKTGYRKDDLKIGKKFKKLFFPLGKQIDKLSSEGLEEQLKYFNLKK